MKHNRRSCENRGLLLIDRAVSELPTVELARLQRFPTPTMIYIVVLPRHEKNLR